MGYCVVMTTCGRREEAEDLAAKIIENRLAACVQLSEVASYYKWENEVCHEPETRLLIKTTHAGLEPLEGFIKANHGYDVPQIISLKIESGSPEYLAWIDEAVQ